MLDFSAEEYQKRLAMSADCDTCEKVPLTKLNNSERYIFISYSHKDYRKVYSDLADLYESDIPFWYDNGLPAGKNWDDEVREKITDPCCAGVIFYLSESLFLSRAIQTEIRIACGLDGNPLTPMIKRNYFSVNLTNMPPSGILRKVYKDKQFFDSDDEMSAISDWVSTLNTAFPDKATFLSFDSPHHKTNLVEQINIVFGIQPNYNPYYFGGAVFRSGNAVIEFENGAVYDGDFVNGLFEGQGIMTYPSGTSYVGEWKKGTWHGHGTITYANGSSYTGEWEKGNWHGHGTVIFDDGSSYTSMWANNEPYGQGTMTYPDGSSKTVEWDDDE